MQHAALITHFTAKTKSVIRTLDTNNELTFLRIRYRNHEIMMAPDKDYTSSSCCRRAEPGVTQSGLKVNEGGATLARASLLSFLSLALVAPPSLLSLCLDTIERERQEKRERGRRSRRRERRSNAKAATGKGGDLFCSAEE